MPFMPFSILGLWFRGVLSVAILSCGIYFLGRWYNDSHVSELTPVAVSPVDRVKEKPGSGIETTIETKTLVSTVRVFRFNPGWNRPTYELSAGLALLLWATMGRLIGNGFWMVRLRAGTSSPGEGPGRESVAQEARKQETDKGNLRSIASGSESDEDPIELRSNEVYSIPRPNGGILHVECYGPPDAPPIIWTHGWGASSTEWFYQKRHLTDRFRLIVWDIAGLGLSKKPSDNDYRLETLAADLNAVLALAENKPAILVGHSIGGMATLTFCKQYPEALASKVSGLVLVHTTYTNPVRTTSMAGFYSTIEKPVIVPLLYLTIALWPLAWLMTWLSYFNGSVHRSTHKESFSGRETRGQLDFVSRYLPLARPDVLARGMLGMLSYDATSVLPGISVPTLVIVGDQDTTTVPAAGSYMAEQIPVAELKTLSPAKHMGLFEHHENFDRLVEKFVETCHSTSTARRPRD